MTLSPLFQNHLCGFKKWCDNCQSMKEGYGPQSEGLPNSILYLIFVGQLLVTAVQGTAQTSRLTISTRLTSKEFSIFCSVRPMRGRMYVSNEVSEVGRTKPIEQKFSHCSWQWLLLWR